MSAAQDQQMRQLLAELELTSNGRTTSWGSSGGGESDAHTPPTGDPDPPHLHYRERYAKCHSDHARDEVIAAARDELKRLRRYTPPANPKPESLEQRNKRIVKDGRGWTVREVAVAFRCGERDVVNARMAAEVTVDRGYEKGDQVPAAERRGKVAEMKARGLTQRQMAQILGVGQTQIRRDLEDAA